MRIDTMQCKQSNLGASLALLKKHIDQDFHIDWDSEEGTRVKELAGSYFELKNQLDHLQYNVPKSQCLSTSTFLKDNTDFFIKFLMLNDECLQLTEEVKQVIKHLNNCYWCFIEYSKIMKQFATKMISLETGGDHNES